jgi:hypothetical protein
MSRSRRRRSKRRHYGSVEILVRERTYLAGPLLAGVATDTFHAQLEGHEVQVGNLRIQCFRESGLVCVACGLEGAFFALELIQSKNYTGWAINLYGRRLGGEEVVFTKDHVKPLSLGGPNTLENLQTMCWPCNQSKGSNWESDSAPA